MSLKEHAAAIAALQARLATLQAALAYRAPPITPRDFLPQLGAA